MSKPNVKIIPVKNLLKTIKSFSQKAKESKKENLTSKLEYIHECISITKINQVKNTKYLRHFMLEICLSCAYYLSDQSIIEKEYELDILAKGIT